MTHRFPLKEIAAQAGLGTATVDRVINNRVHVSVQTKRRVLDAITELEHQESQLAARGRRMFFDFVVEAPSRFSTEVKAATQTVAAGLQMAVCRPRFLLQDHMAEAAVIAALERITKRGSQGIFLKARNTARICQAVDKVVCKGIPVVTVVTDLDCNRLAYVGVDNTAAGTTAAFLVAKTIQQTTGCVLTTKSQDTFLGEEERERAFRTTLATLKPQLDIISATGGRGLNYDTRALLELTVPRLADLYGVYSMGGGNAAILDVLNDRKIHPEVFIAHDLDTENRQLIANNKLDFVLHHDLQWDLTQGFNALMSFHGLLPTQSTPCPSQVQIITPFNVPDQQRPR